MLRNLFDGPGIIIIAVLVIVLFGYKRLPDAAKGIGKSMRIFKAEVKQMKSDDEPPAGREPERPVQPLEGRVVDGQRATTPGESARRDV